MDKKDAVTIARFLFLNRDSIHRPPSSQQTTDLKDLARERESILKMIASMKNDIKRILQSTFPELEQLVDVLGVTMLGLLKLFPSARLIAQATPETVAKASDQGDGRRRISVDYTEIIHLAKTSVATTSPSKELILPGKIETLLHLKKRGAAITGMLVKLCRSVNQEELPSLTRYAASPGRRLPPSSQNLATIRASHPTKRYWPLRAWTLPSTSRGSSRV